MKKVRVIALISVLALLGMTAGGASSQKPGPLEPSAPAGAVAAAISYQGRLVSPTSGAPLTGTYDIEFTFWSLSAGGSQIGSTISRNAQVIAGGLYSTQLPVDPTDINGQELWLRIRVRATGGTWQTLSPRVRVLPTAYALSLRPGAQIEGEPSAWAGSVLNVAMDGAYPVASAVQATTATGAGLYGNSTGGYGLYGYSENGYGVYGVDGGSTVARGYGGFFASSNGVGVYGVSGAGLYYTNMYAPGVYGKSTNGAGVYGVGMGTTWPANGGVFEGRTGVYARGTGPDTEWGYAGYFVSESYRGIYAFSQSGWYDGYFPGLGGIYSAGGYWSLYADRTVVVNGGDETLEPGDVVAIAGVSDPLMDGGEPLLAVRQASGTSDIAVVGVVAQAVRVQEKEPPDDPSGPKQPDVQPVAGNVAPGGYLAIISHGLAPAVKVIAPAEGLRVGDLLVASAAPGRAEVRRAGGGSAGTVLGKVAGPLDPTTGTAPVFVTLQ